MFCIRVAAKSNNDANYFQNESYNIKTEIYHHKGLIFTNCSPPTEKAKSK